MINPPYLNWTSQLLRCKGSLVHFCAIKNAKLVFHGANPSICLKGIFGLMEQRRLGGKKTDVVSFCWWCLSASASIALHQLPQQFGLLIAVGDKSRNSLSLGGRWWWLCSLTLISTVSSVVISHLQKHHPLVSHSAIGTINMNTQHESFPSRHGSPREQNGLLQLETASIQI